MVTSQVRGSFAEVVDILLRPPDESNSVDEVNIALAALAMLPVTVRRLSLACKSGYPHRRFRELCPTKLIPLARSASPDLVGNHIGGAGAAYINWLSNLTSLDLAFNTTFNDPRAAGSALLATLTKLTFLGLHN